MRSTSNSDNGSDYPIPELAVQVLALIRMILTDKFASFLAVLGLQTGKIDQNVAKTFHHPKHRRTMRPKIGPIHHKRKVA
ncbi:hypothetical protein AAY53_08745 [Vibrio metoecus]|uniref:Transposase n=1 Tax=Vibrio metoecus TaxID=1481663 RepID=A0ABR4RZC6_VIBMT|nr:hypothetical protein DP83_04230 [Vibrio metoecus]KQA26794.1 hypothetical protein AAY53_08745 [Vibrio metoecus]KQA98293.1 hypothetical protein XV91_13965 [Vibrio metoecus]KQB10722.1 hypothetical protein XV94_02585 [Vibrio metoecus]